MNPKIMTAAQAVALIQDGAVLATEGFYGSAFPEELAVELEQRFLQTGAPKDLTLIAAQVQGDRADKGVNHFAHEGLLKRIIGGHWATAPKLQKLASENKVEAYNWPLGVVTHMFRDAAAHKPGVVTKVGTMTFVDPRLDGGKLNEKAQEDIIDLVNIGGEDYLVYKTIDIDVVILRGTYADTEGNISMEHEALPASALASAQAAHNTGGIVIAQVEEVVATGSLDPKLVRVPGILVDVIVKASDPQYQMQTNEWFFNPGVSGQARMSMGALAPMALSERKVIARRAAMEIEKGSVVNLGAGMPEGVAAVVAEQGRGDDFILTVEAGHAGGVPQSGNNFGSAINPQSVVQIPEQFDFYHGGGLDIAFMGLAEVDGKGDVNVSKFGPSIPGCGGFIEITQNTPKVVYCGTFTAKGFKCKVADGKLEILQEGAMQKFVPKVQHVTFSGEYAAQTGCEVLYVTERAVFQCTADGMELIEVAPGIDIEKDILPHMGFTPIIKNVKTMDAALFME